jgi:hypothetical protein
MGGVPIPHPTRRVGLEIPDNRLDKQPTAKGATAFDRSWVPLKQRLNPGKLIISHTISLYRYALLREGSL